MKKYELTDEKKSIYTHTVYRIKALRSFSDVKEGDLGGWIGTENNLSHDGNCWVYDEAHVYEDARVYGNACVYENATVNHNAKVLGNANIRGNTHLFGHPQVYGDASIAGNVKIYGCPLIFGSAQIFENAIISGDAHVADAIIQGYARIGGEAHVFGYAEVSGSAQVRGNAVVSGKAKIECENDILWFSSIGPEHKTLTAYKTKDGGIEVTYERSRWSIAKFKKEIKKMHSEDPTFKEYELLVAVIEMRFKSA